MNVQSTDRFTSETEEFYERYPEVDLDTLGDDVWKRVKDGENLSKVYSELDEKNKDIQRRNLENRASSFGSIGTPRRQAGVYNRHDVEKMDRKTVRKEYDNIIKSMNSKGFFS